MRIADCGLRCPCCDYGPGVIEQITVRRVASAGFFRVEDDRFGAAFVSGDQFVQLLEIAVVVTGPDGIDEHRHPSAADEAVIPAVISVEVKGENLAFAFIQQTQRFAFDLGFHATAAERAGLRTVGKNEHRRPGLLRRRSAGFDEHGIRHRLIVLQGVLQVGKDFSHDVDARWCFVSTQACPMSRLRTALGECLLHRTCVQIVFACYRIRLSFEER